MIKDTVVNGCNNAPHRSLYNALGLTEEELQKPLIAVVSSYTCYSFSEDQKIFNPDGKEIVAKDNACSVLRKEDMAKAYFNCHTDITIPYKELALIEVLHKDGTAEALIRDGRFVLPGTEELNKPFEKEELTYQ